MANKTEKRRAQRARARARSGVSPQPSQYKLKDLDVILFLQPCVNKYRARAEKVLEVWGKDTFNTIHIDFYNTNGIIDWCPVVQSRVDKKYYYEGIEVFKAPKDVKRKVINYLRIMAGNTVDESIWSELDHFKGSLYLKRPFQDYLVK